MRAEHANVGNTDRTRVKDGRDSGANSTDVRVNTAHADARRSCPIADVSVDIDQARHDIPFFRANLEHARGLAHGNVRLNGGNFTPRNTDIHVPVEALARVQYVSPLDQQVIRHARLAYVRYPRFLREQVRDRG